MASNWPGAESGALSKQYVNFIYIPSALVLVGCAIIRAEWLPYAGILVSALGAWQFYDMRAHSTSYDYGNDRYADVIAEPKKVLNPKVFQEFELQEKTVLSHNTAIYRFKLPTPKSILGLPIGQHISIAADLNVEGKQKEVVRSYTPISSDENKGYFDLLIKSYPTGNISKHMASLKIGQALRVRGPKGAMVYTPNLVRHFGMIAGGTGITPMLQVVRAIVRGRPRNGGRDNTEVDLIFANVNPEDILLKEDLDALAKEDDKFRVHYVLNNPPEKWDGGVGFVTADMIKVSILYDLT